MDIKHRIITSFTNTIIKNFVFIHLIIDRSSFYIFI
nr:MAG TPA: hypothetical protein [Caudoviricetes sp.]